MKRSERRSIARIESTYMKQYDAYVERQNKKKKRLYRRLVLFAVLVVIMLGSLTVYHVQQRNLHAEKQEQYERLQEQMAVLKKEEKELREEANLLEDEEYVLEIARTNYFLSKEGELIFKLPEEKPSY